MYNHVCPKCGRAFGTDNFQPVQKCPYCAHQFVSRSGDATQGYQRANGPFDIGPSGKCRGVAAILAIIVGAIGVHYFYVGKVGMGLTFLLVSICSCGILATLTCIVSFIQGILMLIMSEEEFESRYVNNPSSFVL